MQEDHHPAGGLKGRSDSLKMIWDCVIIGGGPAGLNAALVLGRSRRTAALIDNDQPRNRVTRVSHGYLTRDGVRPEQFRNLAYEEIGRYPTVRRFMATALEVNSARGAFRVITSMREEVWARTLILATGLHETLPRIPGLEPLYGKSIFNCVYCDGYELQDRPLFVLSEQPGLYHFVKTVHHWSRDLIVLTNGKPVLTSGEKEKLQVKGVPVVEEPIHSFRGDGGQLTEVVFHSGAFVTRAGGFIVPHWSQKAPFAAQLGCRSDGAGGIAVDELGRTSVKGVYAAGDTARFGPSQLIIAAGQGSKAAMAVNADLIDEEF